MRHWYGALAFTIAVVAIGVMIGLLNLPGEWYAGLNKPWFNPPNWLFGPVWTILYALIGFAGWRTWPDPSLRTVWLIQMLLNFAWSPLFFGVHHVGAALAVILALLAAILAFVWKARRVDPLASGLFLPYAAWVAFASLLNGALWHLN